MVAILARYASGFGAALDLTVDASLLWVGRCWRWSRLSSRLSFPARRPTAHVVGWSGGSVRITGGTSRRLQASR
jgi:hypothetical protein